MDPSIVRQIGRLHASPTMAVLAVAGGGAQVLGWLLGVPGASRTVLEVLVPYAPRSLAEFLGYEPEAVVDAATARDMAHAAYRRARVLRVGGAPLAGLGSTSAIKTDRRKRGEHRCFVSVWTEDNVATYALTFAKGLRGRTDEDRVVSSLVLRALADASSVDFDLGIQLLPGERLQVTNSSHEDLIGRLLAGEIKAVTVRPDGETVAAGSFVGGVLAGSFAPLHSGHTGLAEAAAQVLGRPVVFELSVVNVDKPDLAADEVRNRVQPFAGAATLVVTRAPTFHQKAALFPGCTFVVGLDTAARLVDPRYYGGDEDRMLSALAQIRESGCRFLVAGRLLEGRFRTLADIAVPDGFSGLLAPIPEEVFRHDMSSTDFRQAAG